jgi:Carbohydrate binding module (family 6)
LLRNFSVGLWLAFGFVLPRVAAAATIPVPAGGNLQAAIDAAKPGDVIELAAGATFDGPFKLRAKAGMSATSRITIRSVLSSGLPAAGVRITPAAAPLLANIRATTAGPAMRTEPGAAYWTLMFLEFMQSASNGSVSLVELGGAGTSQSTLASVPHHLVVDRCYLHGNPSYGQRRGLALNSGNTSVINSYFSDFKGVLQDTQAICGWNGPGPFLIENNHLEAAGENIMFGGNDPAIPNLIPTNIKIRRNLITKPTAWMTQSWTVKNLMEFKNAKDVVIEGNTIENNWAAGQQGYSIVLTPRNQNNTAPWVIVKNVVIQNNVIRHVAAAFNILGYDDISTSQQTQDILIRNNLIYDVNTRWQTAGSPANGRLAIIGAGPKNIVFDHNTVDNNGSSTLYFYGGKTPTGVRITGFELTNNLLRMSTYGVFGDKIGQGTVAFNYYTPSAIVQRNTLAGASAKLYPVGNDFPTVAQWLADFINVGAADYRLKATSLSNNAGTDGKDLGVDYTELLAALNGTASAPLSEPPPPPSTGGSTPYGGTAPTLPGKVQFENYDAGGMDIAYYDTTASNSGAVYRSNAVDIQASTDTGGGYNIGWTAAREWLKYTVKVAAAGTYAIDIRVASKGGGGTFHIEVNGVNKTGPIAVADTGGWQAWKTLTKTGVALAAGTQVIRVVMDTTGASGDVANFNWFAIR